MATKLIEVTHANVAYLCLGGFVVFFSMVSLLVKEKLYLGEPVLATAFGIALGPVGAGVFNPRSWGEINAVTLEVMRVVLGAGVFAIGVDLPKSYIAKHWRSLFFMVVPSMAFGWLVSAGLIVALFPKLNWISALVISASVTPTDPILATSILTGKFAVKNVPNSLRLLLAAESALNDCLAYPFLTISLYLTLEASRRVAIEKWFLIGWLYQIVLGVVLGGLLGTAFCYILKFAQKRGYIDRESFVAQYLALALFTIGLANLLGTDDLLTAFAAGTAISWDGEFNVQTENDVFSAILDLVLNSAAFIYIGAWIPFADFNIPELGVTPWRLAVFAISLLALRRIPALMMLEKLIPEVRGWREALFCGHFGPMGVGAVYISTFALVKLPAQLSAADPTDQVDVLSRAIQPIVAFVVLVSVLIHGLSIPFFSLGKQVHGRTLTLTQTWTFSRRGSMENSGPEWIQATHKAERPAAETGNADPFYAASQGSNNHNTVTSFNMIPGASGNASPREFTSPEKSPKTSVGARSSFLEPNGTISIPQGSSTVSLDMVVSMSAGGRKIRSNADPIPIGQCGC